MPADTFDGVLPRAMATIRAASALAAKDIKFHASVDQNSAQAFENSASSLLEIANRLLAPHGPDAAREEVLEFGEKAASSDGSWKKVSDMLDVFFEKADLAMDAMKTPKPASEYLSLNDSSDAGLTVTVSEKPQIHFREPVDNSETHPFRPRLSSKPHATTPLEQCLKVVQDGDAPPHYPQPYHDEIMASAYPESVQKRGPEQASTDWTNTAAIWVDSVEGLREMIAELEHSPEIAVDLEHHDLRTYYGITCLMQISNRTQDWIVDTLKLRDDLRPLNVVFANPAIVKVFHGANMDIIWLQRDLGLYVVSLFDTYHASRALGFPKFSLAYLLETFAKFKTSKKYQLADWRVRPIPAVMMDYARSDTHFLLNIYDQLRNKLIDADPAKLTEVLENSRKVACRRFEYVKFRPPTGYNSGMFNEAVSADNFIASYNIPASKHGLVRQIFTWRDNLARDLDESPRYIMPGRVVVNICCLSEPITPQQILNCFTSFSKIVRENIDSLTALVQDSFKAMEEDKTVVTESAPTFEVTAASVQEMAELFSFLVEKAKGSENHEIIDYSSRIFSGILSEKGFSVQVPENSAKPRVVTTDELQHRLDLANSITFTPVRQAAFSATESKPESKPEAEETKSEEVAEAPENHSAEPKDEIVALLPKRNRQQYTKKNESSEEPVFDYSATETKVLANVEPIRRKKRSYQTFGTEEGGPQAFKGRKMAPEGKTTSFTKKRK